MFFKKPKPSSPTQADAFATFRFSPNDILFKAGQAGLSLRAQADVLPARIVAPWCSWRCSRRVYSWKRRYPIFRRSPSYPSISSLQNELRFEQPCMATRRYALKFMPARRP